MAAVSYYKRKKNILRSKEKQKLSTGFSNHTLSIKKLIYSPDYLHFQWAILARNSDTCDHFVQCIFFMSIDWFYYFFFTFSSLHLSVIFIGHGGNTKGFKGFDIIFVGKNENLTYSIRSLNQRAIVYCIPRTTFTNFHKF